MGGSTAWSGTDLPHEVGAFTTYNMSPRGPAFANAILKDLVIDTTLHAVGVDPTGYMGARLTAPTLIVEGSRTPITGYVISVTDAGLATGAGSTAWDTDLQPGDTIIASAGATSPVPYETASFAVVEVINDNHALVITVQGTAFGVPGVKVDGVIHRVRRPIFAPPFLFNHEAYMVGDDANSLVHLDASLLIQTDARDPGEQAVLNLLGTGSEFALTMTEAQLGLDTFADVATAKAELQKSVAAATAGLAAANAVIALAASGNIATSITTYAAPMVAALIAQRDADVLSLQKGYTIANGFFNTNTGDRVADLMNKYAVQEAAMLADVGLKVLTLLNNNAVQAIDMLLRFQNGPLRDRVMAQELRLKALDVGAHVFLAADTALQQRWSAMYGAAVDAVKRDYANDHAMWGIREDTMRFNAELQQAYLGTVNAGIGKGTDAMGVTKQVLGMAIATAGAVAAFVPGGGGGGKGADALISGKP